MTTQAKMAAARAAVDQAAALLLEHAEGLAMLAMMADWRDRNPDLVDEATDDPQGGVPFILYRHAEGAPPFIRNRAAEDAYWRMVQIAAAFAGAKDAHTASVEMWSNPLFHSALRSALEQVVGPGPNGGPSPSVAHTAKSIGDQYPEVTAEQVHAQTWRDRLMSSASAFVHQSPGVGA